MPKFLPQATDPKAIKAYKDWIKQQGGSGPSLDWVESILEDFEFLVARELSKLKPPITYIGQSGYSYTFDPKNPYMVTASDGSRFRISSILALGQYDENFYYNVLEMRPEVALENFRSRFIDQEQFEEEQLSGGPSLPRRSVEKYEEGQCIACGKTKPVAYAGRAGSLSVYLCKGCMPDKEEILLELRKEGYTC